MRISIFNIFHFKYIQVTFFLYRPHIQKLIVTFLFSRSRHQYICQLLKTLPRADLATTRCSLLLMHYVCLINYIYATSGCEDGFSLNVGIDVETWEKKGTIEFLFRGLSKKNFYLYKFEADPLNTPYLSLQKVVSVNCIIP